MRRRGGGKSLSYMLISLASRPRRSGGRRGSCLPEVEDFARLMGTRRLKAQRKGNAFFFFWSDEGMKGEGWLSALRYVSREKGKKKKANVAAWPERSIITQVVSSKGPDALILARYDVCLLLLVPPHGSVVHCLSHWLFPVATCDRRKGVLD